MEQKFFGSFFLKKELLAFFLLARLGYGSTIKAAGFILKAAQHDDTDARC
jgi:hypothetical protein